MMKDKSIEIPESIYLIKDVSGTDKIFLALINGFENGCDMNNREIGEILDLKTSVCVTNAISKLVKRGYISVRGDYRKRRLFLTDKVDSRNLPPIITAAV
jgi:DNA-binding MarR family transcriptional regulator